MLLTLALTLFASLQGGPTYSIAGQLRDSEGKAAAGVRVSAYIPELASIKQRPPGSSALSRADGTFIINLDRPGKYSVIYDDRDRGYFPQSIPFFRDPNNPPPQVVLTDVSSTAQVIFSMSKNGVLNGEAIDAQTQLPIDYVDFTMCHAENRKPCWHTSAKSASGKFSIPTPFVPFTLLITSAEFEDWFGLTGSDQNVPVIVPAGTSTSLRLLMKRKSLFFVQTPEDAYQTAKIEAANRPISEAKKRIGINLPAPKQLLPEDSQVFDIYPRLTKLEWEAVEGAAWYALELDYCQYHKGTHQWLDTTHQCIDPQSYPATSRIKATSHEFIFIGAQPGRWRVWAVDREGREGFKSVWRTFLYLR